MTDTADNRMTGGGGVEEYVDVRKAWATLGRMGSVEVEFEGRDGSCVFVAMSGAKAVALAADLARTAAIGFGGKEPGEA